MKPSLKIEEIRRAMSDKSGITVELAHIIPAIIQYLDEEYERNKPCEHKTTEIREDGYGRKFKKCMVCGQSPV